MNGYVDIYALPIKKKQLARYRSIANVFGAIIREHGALEYREFLADDVKGAMAKPLLTALKLKAGEVAIYSVVGFRTKAHRNQVNKKAMTDPRMIAMAEKTKGAFDMKRMGMGGFKTFIDWTDK